MPGFFITNSGRVPALKNYDPSRCVDGELRWGQWTVRWSVLDKFLDDKLFYQDEDCILVLDGIVFNKAELMKKAGSNSWPHAVKELYRNSGEFFRAFRGAFSGAVYDKAKDRWTVFTDQLGNRLVLQCAAGDQVAFGSQINYFSDWMKDNGIPREISPQWENDFFAFGYMLDKYTILKGVERVFPGCYATYDAEEKRLTETAYYRVEKKPVQRTEDEAIQALDEAFRKAVARSIEKCREYGYGIIVDVSGGLDSRMIAKVFAEENKSVSCKAMGINYAQTGSADYRLAQQVAGALGLDMVSLMMDGGNCLKEIEDLVFMNQGMNYFLGITGGKTVLEMLDRKAYGLELWGILGDIYEGAMIVEEDISKPDWNYPRFRTGGLFQNSNTYRDYPDNEIMWFYIRGMLAGANTAFIRQNFVEAPAVYGDVEFLEVLFSIPYEQRTKDCVLRKWLIRRYKDMADIPYSGTGIKVTEQFALDRAAVFARRVWNKIASRLWKDRHRRTASMNPLDYWYEKNESLRACWDSYYAENLALVAPDSQLHRKLEQLYSGKNANALSRSMALTAVSAIRQFVVN